MKRHILFLSAMLLASGGLAYADDLSGTHEVSFSGQAGQLSSREEVTSDYGIQGYSNTYEETRTFFTLALRYGVFVYHGLEIEPELHWSATEQVEPALSIHANAVYNFDVSPQPGHPRGMPFILAGYGIGNAAPFLHTFVSRTSENFDVTVLNLGAGLKAFVSERAALRVEYRFQRYSYEETYGSTTYKSTDSYSNIFFGFSIFFPPQNRASVSESGGCSGCGMDN